MAGLAVVGQQSFAQDETPRSLVDALNQDFDAYVANIDAGILRQFSQADAAEPSKGTLAVGAGLLCRCRGAIQF